MNPKETKMSIVPLKQQEFGVSDLDSIHSVSERLMQTPHYKKLGPDGIFAVVSKAKSLGINPLEALDGGLYYVQGKVGMSAEMMNALIRAQGHSIKKDDRSTTQCVILHGRRKDNGDTWTVSFSIEDAKRAGLLKNMYEKYPAIMLYNRAMSILARQLFPDVIKGCGYTHEELKEIDNRPQEEEAVELISDEQLAALEEVVGNNGFRKNLMEFLVKQHNIYSLRELPLSLFDQIYKNAKLARDSWKKEQEKLVEEEMAKTEEE